MGFNGFAIDQEDNYVVACLDKDACLCVHVQSLVYFGNSYRNLIIVTVTINARKYRCSDEKIMPINGVIGIRVLIEGVGCRHVDIVFLGWHVIR